MATKQITDLDPATSFDAGDLLLLRKTGEGVDKKIDQATFIRTLGNPAVTGFTATSPAPNELVLASVNDVVIDTYYNGMVVTFVSPIMNGAAVTMKIGSLPYKELLDIETATTPILEVGHFYQAVYVGDFATGKFYQTNVEQATLPTVYGFTAGSGTANQVTLTPSNFILTDTYYDGMVVSFVSPINSSGTVSIKIGSLPLKNLRQIGTATSSILEVDKFYQAIYIGTPETGRFYQTNIVQPFIYTNEYISVGTVQVGELSTKYVLTSAKGTTKTEYYTGMSAIFTVDIASKGAVILNIDGLGEKTLLDPVGDDIPFNLLANETIICIYDGTTFRKHMFSSVEPEPIDPPSDVIIPVGPSRELKHVTQAIYQLVDQYTENGQGRTFTIQLDSNYVWDTNEAILTYNTSWITVRTALLGNNFNRPIVIGSRANINFTGIFNFAGFTSYYHILVAVNSSNPNIKFKDSTINCVGSFAETQTAVYFGGTNGVVTFDNVNINNYDCLVNEVANGTGNTLNYTTGVVVIRNSITDTFPIIQSVKSLINLSDVNFGSVTKATAVNTLIVISGQALFNNVTLNSATPCVPLYLTNASNLQSVLTNCTIKNTTSTAVYTVRSDAGLIIDGGDYRHTQLTPATDIVAANYVAAVIRLRNNPLGTTGTIGQGRIVSE